MSDLPEQLHGCLLVLERVLKSLFGKGVWIKTGWGQVLLGLVGERQRQQLIHQSAGPLLALGNALQLFEDDLL